MNARPAVLFTLLFLALVLAGCVRPTDGGQVTLDTDLALDQNLYVPQNSSATYTATSGGFRGNIQLDVERRDDLLQVTLLGIGQAESTTSVNATATIRVLDGATESTSTQSTACAILCAPTRTSFQYYGPQRWIPGTDYPLYHEDPTPWFIPIGAAWMAHAAAGEWSGIDREVHWAGDHWNLTAKSWCFQGCGYAQRDSGDPTMVLQAHGDRGSIFPTSWVLSSAGEPTLISLQLVESATHDEQHAAIQAPGPFARPEPRTLPHQWVPDLAPTFGPEWNLTQRLADLRQDPVWQIHGDESLVLRYALATSAAMRASTGYSVVTSFHFPADDGQSMHMFRQLAPVGLMGGTEAMIWEYDESAYTAGEQYHQPYLMDPKAPEQHASVVDGAKLEAIQFYRTTLAGSLGGTYVVYLGEDGAITQSLAGDYLLKRQ